MRLDVPFIFDEGYADWLGARAAATGRIGSVHFSLGSSHAADARGVWKAVEPERLIRCLRSVPGVQRYGLLNARFHAPGAYASGELCGLIDLLDRLVGQGVLDGVVLADAYLLVALSDASPTLASALEAVPSVNCRLDSRRRVATWMERIASTLFRTPGRVVLDRRLNREPETLHEVAAFCREKYGLEVGLLANEGCLAECPYRQAHESHIGLSRLGGGDATSGMNRELGCSRVFFERPGALLASPFIRPEDTRRYAGSADFLKVCGRTRGPRILAAIVDAYLKERFTGNLLTLLDAPEPLADVLHLFGDDLPSDFLDVVSSCDGACSACDWCDELAGRIVRRNSPVLTDFPKPF